MNRVIADRFAQKRLELRQIRGLALHQILSSRVDMNDQLVGSTVIGSALDAEGN